MQPVTAHKNTYIYDINIDVIYIPDYFIIINSLYIVREDLTFDRKLYTAGIIIIYTGR